MKEEKLLIQEVIIFHKKIEEYIKKLEMKQLEEESTKRAAEINQILMDLRNDHDKNRNAS